MSGFERFYNKYLCLNFSEYENLGVDFEINKFLLFLSLGLCIACIFINYTQATTSLILKKLLRFECFGEEKARSLESLGLSGNRAVKRALSKDSGLLRRIVRRLGEKKLSYEEYIELQRLQREAKKQSRLKRKAAATEGAKHSSDEGKPQGEAIQLPGSDTTSEALAQNTALTAPSYYIPEEEKEKALHMLQTNNASWAKTIIGCVVIVGFSLILVFTMPFILSGVNSILG